MAACSPRGRGDHEPTRWTASWGGSLAERKAPQFAPGGKGNHILELQDRLRAAGHADVPQTGVFDRATRKGLSAFQKKAGLRSTGDVDGATLAALTKAAGAAEPPPP